MTLWKPLPFTEFDILTFWCFDLDKWLSWKSFLQSVWSRKICSCVSIRHGVWEEHKGWTRGTAGVTGDWVSCLTTSGRTLVWQQLFQPTGSMVTSFWAWSLSPSHWHCIQEEPWASAWHRVWVLSRCWSTPLRLAAFWREAGRRQRKEEIIYLSDPWNMQARGFTPATVLWVWVGDCLSTPRKCSSHS